ncbi:amidohydrolase [Angomonas deanei]|uniref:Amidohydrolase family, putative n=1 Tax=Angomonas deanei TaxID=59799 RepID=S9VED8_9TRYP|nr:amidohydrolase [Angomonas deanei]EPY30131.1 amidohydrolase [Angomonas deanei]CAD2222701.1 Amidohydrolase family, putative [Angomonas deanei]|eukprot:EPY25461.1 amidohydrolase [Angomonas deanei]
MKSILALINAKKIYKGAPVLDRNAPSVYPPEVNAILMVDGRIHRIGTTKEVCALYESLTPSLEKTTEEAPVEGGRKRASSARQVDCLGKYTLYPGFVESHAHFLDGGRSINNPWLENACSQEEFITILRDFTEHRYTGTGWIFGGGWSEPVLGGCPTRHWLDTVSTDIPMVLYRKDVHTCVLNTAALRICHVLGEEEPIIRNVSGGRIELDEAGEPNGILRDNAIHAVAKYFPPTDSPLNKESALHSATEYYLSRGFTTVFSMMSTQFKDHTADVLFLKDAERKGDLRIRVRYGAPLDSLSVVADTLYTPVKDSGRTDTFTLPHRFTCIPPQEGGSFFFLGAIKLFGDGALGSRTAAMNRPYGYNVQTEGDINSELEDVDIEKILVDPNRPECQCGLLIMQRGELQEAVRAVHARGLQVVAHGIGDRAVANVNKALCDSGRALRSAPDQTAFHQDPRSRVEHCQHIGNVSKEVSRMQECHIIASMQPCHLLFDGDYVEDLIGINRKNKSYLWGTFLKHNIRVNLGSDWPVAPADVCDGLRGAVTRVPDVMASLAAEKNGKTLPEGTKRYHEVWSKEECISMDDALRCYTYEAAHGAFLEDVVGSLEEGKYADVTVWSDDWLDSSNMVPLGDSGEKWWRPADQPELLYTIVGGNIEFQKQ